MPFSYRQTIRAGRNTRVTVSKRGATVSEKLGPVTVNSRCRVSVRLMPGLTFRLGGKR